MVWSGTVRSGEAWCGMAWQGTAGHGLIRSWGGELERKELILAEQLSKIREDVKSLAKTLRISPEATLRLLSHREIVILNAELKAIHEMLDLLYGEKLKKKGG